LKKKHHKAIAGKRNQGTAKSRLAKKNKRKWKQNKSSKGIAEAGGKVPDFFGKEKVSKKIGEKRESERQREIQPVRYKNNGLEGE